MDPTTVPPSTRGDGYRIRQARTSDIDAIQALYQSVLDEAYSRDWFDWKYQANPNTDQIPVVVATAHSEIVGAGGFLPTRMHTGRHDIPAVQPCDAAVYPDHRQNGLYTDILGTGLEYFAASGTAFAFDFPNALSRAAFENHGWNAVTTREAYIRVQHPSALVAGLSVPGTDALAHRTSNTIGAINRLRYGSHDRAGVEVVRVRDIPTEQLAAIHRENRPLGIHADRTSDFIAWRFANPLVNYDTYVSLLHGEPHAAIITGRTQVGDAVVTYCKDVLPIGPCEGRNRSLAAILDVIVTEHTDADLLIAPGGVIPSYVLKRAGFLSDLHLPLSLVSDATIHGAKPLAMDEHDGIDLHEPSNWSITFAEYDTR